MIRRWRLFSIDPVDETHSWQEYDLRTATGTGGWLDIQKSAATALGKASHIFKGGLGMHNNAVLH
ncbi:MAG: DUF4043 family protein, partial [Desulfotignum sp.]